MKPDGTATIDEIMAQVEQLQSWEQEELAERISNMWDLARNYIKDMSADDVADLTGYYVSKEDPEDRYDVIDDFNGDVLIQEIIDRDLCVEMLDAIYEHDENIIRNYIF